MQAFLPYFLSDPIFLYKKKKGGVKVQQTVYLPCKWSTGVQYPESHIVPTLARSDLFLQSQE